MANTKFTRAVKKAKALYKTGRYKKFSDAVKAAYKKIGKAGNDSSRGAGHSSTKTRATTTGNKTATKTITANVKIGKAKRKKRHKAPFAMTGISTGTLKAALVRRKKSELANALLRVETATTRHGWLMAKKSVNIKRAELNKLQ